MGMEEWSPVRGYHGWNAVCGESRAHGAGRGKSRKQETGQLFVSWYVTTQTISGNFRLTYRCGRSGSGKTTLLRLLLGLETPDAGELAAVDADGTVSPSKDRHWSVVFQEDRLLEHLDAWGNLRFAPGLSLNTDTGADWNTAAALLKELGLYDASHRTVRTWSGGMKRRLALARALLALPRRDGLILDEPFTGLDDENRRRAIQCVARAAVHSPVILVTHQEDDGGALDANKIYLPERSAFL